MLKDDIGRWTAVITKEVAKIDHVNSRKDHPAVITLRTMIMMSQGVMKTKVGLL